MKTFKNTINNDIWGEIHKFTPIYSLKQIENSHKMFDKVMKEIRNQVKLNRKNKNIKEVHLVREMVSNKIRYCLDCFFEDVLLNNEICPNNNHQFHLGVISEASEDEIMSCLKL